MTYTSEDWDTLARTIFGEARSEPFQGQVAVAWVVRNRADHPTWWGSTVRDVCRRPYQFSCWNENDPNLPKLQAATSADPHFLRALGIAALVIQRDLYDPTNGATHYVADYIDPPEWSAQMVPVVTIGHHKFFKEA